MHTAILIVLLMAVPARGELFAPAAQQPAPKKAAATAQRKTLAPPPKTVTTPSGLNQV
jgi:hypothetical protein